MKKPSFIAVAPRSGHANGFALIEILVSILLIAIGLVGIGGLLAVTHKNSSSSYLRTQATLLGSDIAEKMRANRSYVLANPTAYNQSVSACNTVLTSAPIAEHDLRHFNCLVRSTLPAGSAAIEFDAVTRLLTVAVSWDDSRGTARDTNQSTQTFTLRTQL